ncbi:Druantia anti-phage system protein DruA [Sphingomonas aerolata]|nr:Druantia anti-phage system protein DruA [Sphingomonas aerolata]
MLRSVAVKRNSPAAAFIKKLHRDLVRFGRDDALLIDIGSATAFVWDPDFTSPASATLREEALNMRLGGMRATLAAQEALFPADYFDPFGMDFANLAIDVVPCVDAPSQAMFNYISYGQSVAAETKTMRIGRFLIYDRTPSPHRIMGAIALKSPKYFDGARDRHLGWPALSEMVDGERIKSDAAIKLRNAALKSIFNIAVCMAVPPYDRHGVGKLIAALALSHPVIGHMETKYPNCVLGVTTTGIWSGSAGQYERIRLGRDMIADQRAKLYERTHTVRRSLNYVPAHFSQATYEAAFDMIRRSHVRIQPFHGYDADPAIRQHLLNAALLHLRIPRRAIAANVISHYFGSVSLACREALATVATLNHPPTERSLAIGEIYAEWLTRTAMPAEHDVAPARLSARAT